MPALTVPLEVTGNQSIVGAAAADGFSAGDTTHYGRGVIRTTGEVPNNDLQFRVGGSSSPATQNSKTEGTEIMRLTDTGRLGIGTSAPTAILHSVASGAKTAAYSGNLLTNTATSATASITKAGLEIQSTGTWNGTSASNIGLYVSSVTGGTNNYDAIFNGGGNVGIGTTSPGTKLEVNGAISGWGIAPIGSILPWLKSFANTPQLPDGWAECDGTVLSDANSPYNGQTLPDLNGNNNFLRGNSTSGGTGGGATHDHGGTAGNHTLTIAEIPSHVHSVPIRNGSGGAATPGPGDGNGWAGAYNTDNTGGGGAHSHTITSADSLPPYYNVVWIMRVH